MWIRITRSVLGPACAPVPFGKGDAPYSPRSHLRRMQDFLGADAFVMCSAPGRSRCSDYANTNYSSRKRRVQTERPSR